MTIAVAMLAGQSAWADCTPQATGQSNLIATCSGTTFDQGGGPPGTSIGSNGYGTGAETGTVTVLDGASVAGAVHPGGGIDVSTHSGIDIRAGTVIVGSVATVSGDDYGIHFGSVSSPGAVTNSGSISGSTYGIYAFGNLAVTNNSGAVITGSFGIVAAGDGSITNYGSVAGTFQGIDTSGNANVTNYGSISASDLTNGDGVLAGQNITLTNRAGATIHGGNDGLRTLLGSITVDNFGTISSTNQQGILSPTSVQVNNYAGGTISGGAIGIWALGAGSSVFNAGTISGHFAAIEFTGSDNTLTLAPGSVISGVVLGAGHDTFQLGGSGAATFDMSQLGPLGQYRGFRTFNKIGDSHWTLTGTSTFGGVINVNGGLLSVNGDTSSADVAVYSGGTLGGTGAVGAIFVNNGGTLAPGNSIGTLTVIGKLVFSTASTYLIEVSPSNADRTNVTGQATLGGATVRADFAPGNYINKQYTILNAALGVAGTFGALDTNLSSNFSTSLSYDADDVYLNLALNFAIPGGLNANQQNVGQALTNFFNANGSIPTAFGMLTPAGLTQASGETATGSQQATFNAMNQFMGVLTDPFVAGRGDTTTSSGATPFADDEAARRLSRPERDAFAAMFTKAPVARVYDPHWSVWGAGFGGSQTTDGNANLGSNTATSRLAAAAGGADYHFSPDTVAGFGLAGGATSFSVDNGGTGRSDLFQAGAFVRQQRGAAYILGAAAYGFQDITTDRTVTIAGVDRLHADFNASAYSSRLEGGYRVVTSWLGGVGITPYAAGQFTTFDLPAYAESVLSGTPAFALSYAAKSVTDSRSEIGLRGDKSFALSDALLTLRGRLAWAHDFNSDRSIAATFQSLPGASFVVNGAAQPHDTALTTASVEMKWMNGWSAAATFEGEFADTVHSYAGKGVVRYSW